MQIGAAELRLYVWGTHLRAADTRGKLAPPSSIARRLNAVGHTNCGGIGDPDRI